MEILLFLLGLFYLLVLPILAFIALGNTSGMERRFRGLEDRLRELERKLREQNSAVAEPSKCAEAKQPVAPQPPPLALRPVTVPPAIAVSPLVAAKIHPPTAPTHPPAPVMAPAPIPSARIPFPQAKEAPGEEKPKDPGAEITLGARWATRLGSGFLVIAVVFFGVYISKFSTPGVRLLEVLALAAAVTGAGVWLERQAREFGEAVFAGGLAIFYFAAFAAHAIAAMRVIPEQAIEEGLAVQFLAVAAIAVIACWRNRPQIAMMAVALGMLSCFFALHRDRMEISLGAALGLAGAAAALRVARGWVWPLALGYVGAQICYAGSILVLMGYTLENFFRGEWLNVPLHHLAEEFAPWPGITLVFPTAYFILLLGADLWAERRQRTNSPTLRGGIVLVAAILYGLGGWWGGAEFGHSWDSTNLLAAAIICLGAGAVYQWRKDTPEIYEVLYAAAGTWAAIYLINEYTGYIRWLALLLECFIFAWRARRHGSSFAWVCLYGAWACSFVMAFHDAAQLAASVDAWNAVRLKFALWPVVSLALWAWLEKAPRAVREDERTGLLIGGYVTAAGTVALGWAAWMEPAQTWLWLGIASAALVAGLVGKLRTVWPTVWGTLIFSMWLYAPPVNAATLEVAMVLAVFSASVLGLTALLQSRADWEHKRILAEFGEVVSRDDEKHNRLPTNIGEVVGFLSLLAVWIRGFFALPQGENHLAVALTAAALVLAALAWRGPWRTTGDLAWIWAMTGLVVRGGGHFQFQTVGPDRLCLMMVLALGWLWGALSRKEKPGVYILGLDKTGLILPGFLFVGWTMLAVPCDASDSNWALWLAGSAVSFALIGRREWLPGGGAAAVLLSLGAFIRAITLNIHALDDCWAPAAVGAAFILQGLIPDRRVSQGGGRRSISFCLFVIAAAALLVFDWPVAGLPGVNSRYVTMLWAGAGAGRVHCGAGGALA